MKNSPGGNPAMLNRLVFSYRKKFHMKLQINKFCQGIALLTFVMFIAGCSTDENVIPSNLPIEERGPIGPGGSGSTLLYGLSDRNEIVKLMSGPPVTELERIPITGVKNGDVILAIDIRPATGLIYGLSATGILYTINLNIVNGGSNAKMVSGTPLNPAIAGTIVGFDFDPRSDRIRLVTEKGQNMRINPTTGAVSNIDFPINPGLASMNSIAYGMTLSSITGASLYDIDILGGNLYRQNPTQGTLTFVGPLGLTISGEGGFDISRRGAAFASLFAGIRDGSGGGVGGSGDDGQPAYRIYSINLKTGKATSYGRVNGNLIGLTIP